MNSSITPSKFPFFVCILFLLLSPTLTYSEVIPSPIPGFPTISPGVILDRFPVNSFDGNIVGPINGESYGPDFTSPNFPGFGPIATGQTGWVNSTYVLPAQASSGSYRLFFLVSDVDFDLGLDPPIGDGDLNDGGTSGLAIDNIVVTNAAGATTYSEGFEAGIPSGADPWLVVADNQVTNPVPTTGDPRIVTSSAEPNINPTEGASFAIMDTLGIFDEFNNNQPTNSTLVDFTSLFPGLSSGTSLLSEKFQLDPGGKVSLDLNFLTNEADPFADFALVQLYQEIDGLPDPFSNNPIVTQFTASAEVIPEPSTYVLYGIVLLTLGFLRFKSKKNCKQSSVTQ